MVHTGITISLTSYRSEALGHKAFLLMAPICLLHVCIEIIYLITYSVGCTVQIVTTTAIIALDPAK